LPDESKDAVVILALCTKHRYVAQVIPGQLSRITLRGMLLPKSRPARLLIYATGISLGTCQEALFRLEDFEQHLGAKRFCATSEKYVAGFGYMPLRKNNRRDVFCTLMATGMK